MMTTLLLLCIPTAILGIGLIPIVIMLMVQQIRLRDYVSANHLEELKTFKSNINPEELSSPFHHYELLLNKLDDAKLRKLLTTTKRLKKTFITCFATVAILTILIFALGSLGSIL